MVDAQQRQVLWEEIRRLYEENELTLSEISGWAEVTYGWRPSLSAITNRATRYGWARRAPRCPIFPADMQSRHMRDHYANAVRAEAKVRRGDRLSRTEWEKWRQASSMVSEDLFWHTHQSLGSTRCATTLISPSTSGSVGGETLQMSPTPSPSTRVTGCLACYWVDQSFTLTEPPPT